MQKAVESGAAAPSRAVRIGIATPRVRQQRSHGRVTFAGRGSSNQVPSKIKSTKLAAPSMRDVLSKKCTLKCPASIYNHRHAVKERKHYQSSQPSSKLPYGEFLIYLGVRAQNSSVPTAEVAATPENPRPHRRAHGSVHGAGDGARHGLRVVRIAVSHHRTLRTSECGKHVISGSEIVIASDRGMIGIDHFVRCAYGLHRPGRSNTGPINCTEKGDGRRASSISKSPGDTSGLDALVQAAAIVAPSNVENRNSPTPDKCFKVYHLVRSGRFVQDIRITSCRPSSVVLRTGMLDGIISDVSDFFSSASRDWYARQNVAYSRCLLFHGTHGTGKTTAVEVLASDVGASLYYMDAIASMLSAGIEAVRKLSVKEGEKAIVVIEDVEQVSTTKESVAMFNSLNELLSTRGVLIVLTSSNLRDLPEVLQQVGRVDRTFKFETPGKEEVKKFFLRFYGDEGSTRVEADKFVDKVWARKEGLKVRNLALLQQVFVSCKGLLAAECVSQVEKALDEIMGLSGSTSNTLFPYHI